MPTYRYIGRLIDGTEATGQVRAGNEVELESKLVNKGISLDSYRSVHSRWAMLRVKFLRRGEITKITRQISVLLKSEISILETLELVREQIADRILVEIFDSVRKQVEAGRSVAASLSEYPTIFDRLYVSMVDAGELSGELDTAFDRVASYRESWDNTTRKIKSAIAYPLLVILVAFLVVMALVLYIVPVFSSMYENFGADLPKLTQRVVGFSTMFRSTIYYWVAVAVVLLAGLGYLSTVDRAKFFFHRVLVRLPLIRNLTIKMISARFCRTMGSLLVSGVDIVRALQISSKTTGNLYVDSLLRGAELDLLHGVSFTDAVSSTSIFPRAMLRLSASGEKTGRLGEMLGRAADYYEKETETEINTLTTLIEPFIILILGVFIAFILVAMYLPLFELVGTI
ncbi:MAG: type II secretion system F family protein [Candidatus Zixiibacteriota bacterium]